MKVHTDFASKRHAICFSSTERRLQLNDVESREFEKWLDEKNREYWYLIKEGK